MPETAVHEDGELLLPKSKIRFAENFLIPAPAGRFGAWRNRFTSASSVARLPRLRMRDMTSERLALVKTSGILHVRFALNQPSNATI